MSETLKGAGVIVLAGVALGLAYNALGLASRPPRGMPWVARVEKLPSLEALQAADTAGAPARAWGGGASPAPDTAAPQAPGAPTTTSARTPARPADAARAHPSTTSPPPSPATAPAAPPAATPGGTPATGPPAAHAELPAVPDLDRPIEVQLANVKKFFDAGAALIVDAREAGEYAAGHIAGALSIPFDAAVANPALLDPVKNAGKPVIVYCSGGDCTLSHELAVNMLADGIRKVLVFTGGFPEWQAAGYPVARGAGR